MSDENFWKKRAEALQFELDQVVAKVNDAYSAGFKDGVASLQHPIDAPHPSDIGANPDAHAMWLQGQNNLRTNMKKL